MSCKECEKVENSSSPCFQEGCGCTHRVDTDCIDYSGNLLSCSNISEGTNLTEVLQDIDAYMCYIISLIGSLQIENIGEGEGSFAGIDNLGVREFKSFLSINDNFTIDSTDEEITFDINNSTTSNRGIIQLATQVEVNDLTDVQKSVTPGTLPIASNTQQGLAEIATQVEVNAGTDAVRYVTPATLKVYVDDAIPEIPNATEEQRGIIEIATQVEVDAGTDDERAITPAKYKANLDIRINETINQLEQYIENYVSNPANLPNATTEQRGVAELATSAETQTGTDAERIVTPSSLSSRTATDSRTGLIEIATQSESNALSDTTRAVTPGRQPISSTTQQGLIRIATNTEAEQGTSTTTAITPSNLNNALGGLDLMRILVRAQSSTFNVLSLSPGNTISVTGASSLQCTQENATERLMTLTYSDTNSAYTTAAPILIWEGTDTPGNPWHDSNAVYPTIVQRTSSTLTFALQRIYDNPNGRIIMWLIG